MGARIDLSLSLAVASDVSFPDYRDVPQPQWPTTGWQTSHFVSGFDGEGSLQWTRAWHRDGLPHALNVAAWSMVAQADGSFVWGGQDCHRADSGRCDGLPDAAVVALQPNGEPLWEWRFGHPTGLDRVSDMRAAPDGGLYIAGDFHGPMALPDRAPGCPCSPAAHGVPADTARMVVSGGALALRHLAVSRNPA